MTNQIVIHIASERIVGNIPKIPPYLNNPTLFFEQHQKQTTFLETAKRKKINLKYSGETFIFETKEEVLDKIIELKEIGYSFPSHVTKTLREEIFHHNSL